MLTDSMAFRLVNSRWLLIGFFCSLILLIGIALIAERIYSEDSVIESRCLLRGFDSRLNEIANNRFTEMKLSGEFLVSQNGRVLSEGFCGIASPAARAPLTRETKFNIGSLTKQFTGYLLLELIIEGKIDLGSPIFKYIPEYARLPVGRATIKQLVEMRSGIPYVLPMSDFVALQFSSRIRSEQELVAAIGRLKLEFVPGDKFHYSNLGYSLLGVIIGRVDHGSWAEALKKRIFDPLHMTNTAVEGEVPQPPPGLAVGMLPLSLFSRVYYLVLPHWNYSMIKGAGGMVSTVEDLRRWNQHLDDKSKTDPSWAQAYFPSGWSAAENYRYGWFYSDSAIGTQKVQTISHGGEDPGYCANVVRLPQSETYIVVMTNTDFCVLHDEALRPFTDAVIRYLLRK